MKQFTTPEQTAKLIELGVGFRPALSWQEPFEGRFTTIYNHFPIGELIEMLLSKPHCWVSIYNVGLRQYKVLFKKLINGRFKVLFREVGYEPIDLLFNCIIKLKEEEVI